ncbi:MAG: 23S rRNA (pseudouridine(1915)-N(3))-methyltransferase RlmH [Bdellovibrionales bacterium]|nr:23S rRNA (pseudouridine(1915)-N(3))-methyltransferase RlmH [Bdellovibrionales bacterium]
MKFSLLYISGQKEPYMEMVEEIYLKKINGFLPFQIQAIKAQSSGRDQAQNKSKLENGKILDAIKSGDFVFAFDEKGKAAKDSIEFSHWMVKALESGHQRVVFVLGGPYGLNSLVRKRAQQVISLSPLTLNHHVARVVLLEQIYRGLTIWKNLPYHN